MTLGSVVGAQLPMLQRQAESLMRDTCTIRPETPVADRVFDSSTGRYTGPEQEPIYSGKCRVKDATFRALAVEAGEEQLIVTQVVVSVPLAAAGISEHQILTVDASSDDPTLNTREFQIVNVPQGSLMTARRIVCKEWTGE